MGCGWPFVLRLDEFGFEIEDVDTEAVRKTKISRSITKPIQIINRTGKGK